MAITPPRKRTSSGSAPKRRAPRKNKKKTGGRALIFGACLISGLLVLIGLSIFSLYGKEDGDKALKTAKNFAVSESGYASAGEESAENISAVIRLVLYDYEISRSAVEERVVPGPGGRDTLRFSVKGHDDTLKNVQSALRSVLMKKGYKVVSDAGRLKASGSSDSVEIVFHSTSLTASAAKNNSSAAGKASGSDKKAAGTSVLPTPPAPSDVVVKMAILLDDGGNSEELVERFVKLAYPVGIAVLPHLKHSADAARIAHSYGKPVFLHFPMEPKSYPATDPGKGAVFLNMPEILIEGVAKDNFENLGVPVDGVNNHMGSAVTEDPVKMAQVMKIIKNYTDVFVDSRTTAKSVAYNACVNEGLKCGSNKRFIDNDNDVNNIIGELYKAAEIAKKDGEVIVIGHVRKNTLEALETALPILESRKIAIVPITSSVR